MLTQKQIDALVSLTEKAGQIIMRHYDNEKRVSVMLKADQSPVTIADKDANTCITEGLLAAFPDIPILSEEGPQPKYEQRRSWKKFWLVDPLDGTKEFINRTNNFTVNIALMEDNAPTFGIVGAPYYKTTYYGNVGQGAFKKTAAGIAAISVRPFHTAQPKILLSRSHRGQEYKTICELFPNWQAEGLGSSLKFCLLAEGAADTYVRTHPTSEWDTAAGQCVLSCAGGEVVQFNGQPLLYNKVNTDNPAFAAYTLKGWDKRLLLDKLANWTYA